MSDTSIHNISVVLAGRKYPVIVNEDEVARMTTINECLNQELADLQSRYSNQLSTQDLLAMLLITYANRLAEEQEKNDFSRVQERVDSLEHLLEQVFDQ